MRKPADTWPADLVLKSHSPALLRLAPVLLATVVLAGTSLRAQVAVTTGSETDAPVITPSETEALRAAPSSAPGPVDQAPSANAATGTPVADTERRFHYTLGAVLRGVWDDNIYNSEFHKTDDFYFTIEPSIELRFGDADVGGTSSLGVIYHPSIFLFVNDSTNDTVQQLIRVTAGHGFGHLSLSLAQDISLLDGTDLNSLNDPSGHQANTDVQGRARHQIYNTNLGASYDLTGKLFLSAGGIFYADEYGSSNLNSSQSIGGNLYLNYNYSEKLVIGLGGGGGYNTTDLGSDDQTYEQINARLNYLVTAKISLNASCGVEFRQFEQGGNNITPVYELSASYQPFDGTSMSLNGSRRNENSASFAGQDYTETTINFSITQRLLQRFYLGFAVGYTNSNYFSTLNGISATRNDDFYYIDPSIDFNVTRYWTFGAYYVHREDSSNFVGFSFDDNQVGIRSKLTF
jgi:hypothetical protein